MTTRQQLVSWSEKPYRRGTKPSMEGSFPSFVDEEFGKIERAFSTISLQMSLTFDANGFKLVNDSAAPGINMVYGTDGGGTKGWYAGGGGSPGPAGADGKAVFMVIEPDEPYPTIVPGPMGLQGIQGLMGLQGSPGTDGIDGDDGRPGVAGPQGLTGPQGPQGPQGLPGLDGIDGLDGFDGKPGPQGVPGVSNTPGPQGPPGSDGADGIDGLDGIPGPQGPQGAKGDTGAAGGATNYIVLPNENDYNDGYFPQPPGVDLHGWKFLGYATGTDVVQVGPVIWTGDYEEIYGVYFISGYNNVTVGRLQMGSASISASALTNGSRLSENVTAPTSAPSIPGCPLAVTLTNIARGGSFRISGASGSLKTYNIDGWNGTPAVATPPTLFRAAGSFSDLGTNLPIQRLQLKTYDAISGAVASTRTFNAGTYLSVWGRKSKGP